METVTLQKLISLVLLVHFTVFHSSLIAAADPEADALLNWLNSSWPLFPTNGTSPCTWVGISCNPAGGVVRINLTQLGIEGTLQNFSFSSFPSLIYIDLSMNKFSGPIPSQISQLSKLMYLDLSFNRFSGIIPPEIGLLPNLGTLHLVGNGLSGSIPQEIGQLRSLSHLSLNGNQLDGPIPASFGNLSNLAVLDLSENKLSGPVPPELGNLSNLVELYMDTNNLSGPILSIIGNLPKLTMLHMHQNQLSGPIPQEVGYLKSLEQLNLFRNNLSGPIPAFLGDLKNLTLLHLYENQFSGSIPQELGQLKYLYQLDLSNNQLNASIPPSFGNLSNLEYLSLFYNQLSGSIPEEIGNLAMLSTLHLHNNQFSGYLPQNICQSQPLRNFTVYNNRLEGPIPKSLRDCTSLKGASFERNQFTGNISETFGVYPNLEYIDLGHNQFYGEVSSNWGISSSLGTLKIAGNSISGRIPPKLGDAAQLQALDLSSNQLVGEIPKELAKLAHLSMLHLSWNNLSGEIPSQLSSLQSLEMLNLSHNSLSGSIPGSFAQMRGLLSVDLSYNQLEGPVPNSKAFRNASIEELQGNKGLCGDVQGLQPCKGSSKNRHVSLFLIIFLSLLGASLLLCFFVVLYFSYKRKRHPEPFSVSNFATTGATCHDDYRSRKELDVSRTSQYLPFFDISIILAATENFYNKLGQGGFGSVYKGQLANGQEIAVKRLSKNSGQGIQEFKNEVRLISKLRHRNLVKLIGYCIHEEEKMLIYEYLPNKSLDFFIFDDTRRLLLDWRKRSEIIYGIARGALYLHQDSGLKIIHRDLKASNILLDAAMNPKISDFGLAKLFEEEQVEANTRRVVGTYGYMSPEYAMDGQYSIKSDVFSFGVLTLEIICGKKNTDYDENMPALNLIGHVWNLWSEAKAMDIVDPLLKQPNSQEILRCIQIGLLCVQESPADRPTMLEVLSMLGNEMSISSPKKPAFLLREHSGRKLDLLTTRGEVYSINNVTVSDIEAR